ncbi:galactose mutarotase-like domain-containing protein [Blakeslea trispora]|nr:galactose mutarotase-like domain-containing protein [Blakeslea trispora]
MQYLYAIGILLACCCTLLVYALPEPTQEELETLYNRRLEIILTEAGTSEKNVDTWKNSIDSSGMWPDIDMTSGCEARRANWPAAGHLSRARSLAVAFMKDSSDTAALDAAMLALDYWFDNDYETSDCTLNGGDSKGNCPCGTPGLWNKNWFPQTIGVPKTVGDICIVLRQNLTDSQRLGCDRIQRRSFDTVERWSGANLLDCAYVGITLGIFSQDANLTKSGLEKFYEGVVINPTVADDGIQSDGSFMQHNGLLYNGNYGKDFINNLLLVFVMTRETELTPDVDVQDAFETLISGTEWMVLSDSKRNKLLWQYSVIGRMITFKYSDQQASGGISINPKKISEGVESWENEQDIRDISDRLETVSTDDANQGDLVGTRYFYNADYLVHRGPNFIVTLKMYSSRTVNSECVNTQNPYGFHLSDGAIYNYLSGDEYVDVFGAWDWELIPGTTVDYGGTPLTCVKSKAKGKKKFVGGATDGNTGIAVMDYQNPMNGNLQFKKTLFFSPKGYSVQLGPTSSKNQSSPLLTVLDQRHLNGDVYINGNIEDTESTFDFSDVKDVWHDGIGYYFPSSENIHVDSRLKKSNWSDIGIAEGLEEQQLWTSYINHDSDKDEDEPLTQYIVQLGVDAQSFTESAADNDVPIYLDFSLQSQQVYSAYDKDEDVLAIAFWTAGQYTDPWISMTVTVDRPCVLLLRQMDTNIFRLTIADPSQSLKMVKVTTELEGKSQSSTFTMYTGNRAGKAKTKLVTF